MEKNFEIEQIKKLKDKYSLIINSEKISVPEQIIFDFSLYVGKKMNEGEYEELLRSVTYLNVFNKVLKYITYQPRSQKEVAAYLDKHEVSEQVKDKIFNKLKEYNYLNDDILASSIFEYEKNVKNRGPRAIEGKLISKGIKKEKISELLESYKEEEADEIILSIVDKELLKNRNFPIRKRKKIIVDKLIRDGFERETIYKKVESLEMVDDSYNLLLREVGKMKKRYSKYTENQAKQKIITCLLNKGFEYSSVSKALLEVQEEDEL